MHSGFKDRFRLRRMPLVFLAFGVVIAGGLIAGRACSGKSGEGVVSFQAHEIVTRESVAEAVRTLLQQVCPGGSLHPVFRERDFPIVFAWNNATVSIRCVGGSDCRPASVSITAWDPQTQEGFTRRVPVILKRRTTAVLARAGLRPGDIIQAGDVRIDSVAVPQNAGSVCRFMEEVVGKRVKRAIARDGILTVRDVEPLPAIRCGDRAYLCYETPHFAVRCRVTAMSDGWDGDRIIVRSEATGKKLSATVVVTQTGSCRLQMTPR